MLLRVSKLDKTGSSYYKPLDVSSRSGGGTRNRNRFKVQQSKEKELSKLVIGGSVLEQEQE